MKPLPQIVPSAAPTHAMSLPPCVDRRAFLASSTMMAVGALLATACGDGQIGGGATGPTNVNTTVKISDYPALANVGGIAKLNGTSTAVAVVKTSATQFRAFSMVCPHQQTVVAIFNGGFLCPNHEARYSSTGAVLGQPTDGGTTSPLKEFTVVADLAAGTLTIT